MRKSTLMFGLLALSLVSITSAVAQDSAAASTGQEAQKPAEAPAHFYHLDIVLEQVGADGTAITMRRFAPDRGFPSLPDQGKMARPHNGSTRTSA